MWGITRTNHSKQYFTGLYCKMHFLVSHLLLPLLFLRRRYSRSQWLRSPGDLAVVSYESGRPDSAGQRWTGNGREKPEKQRVNTDVEEASGSSLRPKGAQTHELQTLTHKWMQLILLQLENSQAAVKDCRLQRSWGYGRFKGAVFLIYSSGQRKK